MISPAQKLVGLEVEGGWKVIQRIKKEPNHTGGHFSVGYIVESQNGDRAFLKALDFQKVLQPGTPDPAKKIMEFTSSFVYERDLLRHCRENKLKRIIKSLGDGEVVIENTQVPYIIFEYADSDIRHQANAHDEFDLAWILRTMHHVATGIKQLHINGIAHQDLKPSNVLIINNSDRKIADLGRSATKSCTLTHMHYIITGDKNHAPPEGLYGYAHQEWRERRLGCDAYQVGSLLVFMLTGLSATTLLVESLQEKYRPGIWGGSYHDVLPYLLNAFESSIDFIDSEISESKVKNEILQIIKQLCHPDINQRGDPISRRMNLDPFSMERYISKFEKLAKLFEYKLVH